MKCFFLLLFNFLIIISFNLRAMLLEKEQPQLKSRKRHISQLVCALPPEIANNTLIQFNALNEQEDTFSCAYRTLFHASCLDIALEKAKKGILIGQSLKELLPNTGMLTAVYRKVVRYLNRYDPYLQKNNGLSMNHILGICKKEIPQLANNILPAVLENNEFYTLNDPNRKPAQSPLYYSDTFLKFQGTSTIIPTTHKTEFTTSEGLAFQLRKLEKSFSIAHFICAYPHHVFLASIITDEKSFAKLIVIDPNNNPYYTVPEINLLVSRIHSYVQAHNSIKKPKTS